jgi:hypothetical protein
MNAYVIADLRRELEKTRIALASARTHLAAHAEANAALHMAATVMYSPLHAHVAAAIAAAEQALERTMEAPEQAQRDAALAAVLADLDRCAHGRHEGDVCGDCGGPSKGNDHLPRGTVIGYDIGGRPVVMPDREHKHDPQAWRADERAKRADSQ